MTEGCIDYKLPVDKPNSLDNHQATPLSPRRQSRAGNLAKIHPYY